MTYISSNADEVAARLKAFDTTVALVAWADTTRTTIVDSLRLMSPVGKRIDPRLAGKPHMRDHIFGVRQTSVGKLVEGFVTDVGKYPAYVIGGTGEHVITSKKGGPALAWMTDGGEWRFARSVTHPAVKANRFNDRAWDAVQSLVIDELVARIKEALP